MLVFTAVPSHAGDLTFFGGVQRPGKLTLQSVTGGASVPLDPRDFGTFGIRISQGRVFGSEHTLAYSPNFISSENSAFLYNSNFAIQAPLPGVRPYATAGLGTIWIGGDGLNAITGAKFALNYGGGLKVGGKVGVQFDARGYTIRGVADDTLKVLEMSLGLVFTF